MKPVLFAIALLLPAAQDSLQFSKPYVVGEETFAMKAKIESDGPPADLTVTIVRKVTKVGDDGSANLTLTYKDRTMTFAGQAVSDADASKTLKVDRRGQPIEGDESLRGDVVKMIFLRPSGSIKVGESQKVEWNESKTEKVSGTITLVSVKDKVAKFNIRLAAPGPEKGSVVDFGANTTWNTDTETLLSADGAVVPRKTGGFKRLVFNINRK